MKYKQLVEKLNILLITWEQYATEESFSGLTLSEFRLVMDALEGSQQDVLNLGTRTRGAIGVRRVLTDDTNELFLRIISAVRGHHDPKINTEMLRANGYKLNADRNSGLTRPGNPPEESHPQDEAA